MTDTYEKQRETCKVFQETGKHEVVKGHNTCCCDDNVEVTGGKPLEEQMTQVEKWRKEIRENQDVMRICTKGGGLEECEDCYKRYIKIGQLHLLIQQDHDNNSRFIGRTPQGGECPCGVCNKVSLGARAKEFISKLLN